MPDEVSVGIQPDPKVPPLPQPHGGLLDERNRVAGKLKVAGDLGVAVDAGAAALKALDQALGAALIADAKAEVEAAKAAIEKAGEPPLSPERKRLKELRDALAKLEAERAAREAAGAKPDELARRDAEIARLRRSIERAERRIERAEERARRQAADDLRRAADAVANGAPRPGQGPGNGAGRNPAPAPGGGGGGGGGGGSGGGKPGEPGIDVGIPDSGTTLGDPKKDAKEAPPPAIIFVKGEESVWAWNRSAQRWDQHDFGSPVVGVKELTAGILVVAEHSAAIYDFVWGEWLPAMQTAETLEAP